MVEKLRALELEKQQQSMFATRTIQFALAFLNQKNSPFRSVVREILYSVGIAPVEPELIEQLERVHGSFPRTMFAMRDGIRYFPEFVIGSLDGDKVKTAGVLAHEATHILLHHLLVGRLFGPISDEPGRVLSRTSNLVQDSIINGLLDEELPGMLPDDAVRHQTLGSKAAHVPYHNLMYDAVAKLTLELANEAGIDKIEIPETLYGLEMLFRDLYTKVRDQDRQKQEQKNQDRDGGTSESAKSSSGSKRKNASSSGGNKSTEENESDGEGSGSGESEEGREDESKNDTGGSSGKKRKRQERKEQGGAEGDGGEEKEERDGAEGDGGEEKEERDGNGGNAAIQAVSKVLRDLFGTTSSQDYHSDEELPEMLKDIVENSLRRAAREYGHGIGKGSAFDEILQQILPLLDTNKRSPFASTVLQLLRSKVTERKNENYHRPHRLQPVYGQINRGSRQKVILPVYRDLKGHAMFIYDVSGSMGSQEMSLLACESLRLFESLGNGHVCELIQTDTEVLFRERLETGSGRMRELRQEWLENGFQRFGSGGTDFKNVFEEIAEMREKPDVILFFTDMMVDFTSLQDPNVPVYWLDVSQGVPSSREDVPFGKVLPVDVEHILETEKKPSQRTR
jgi:predicted metal-dependent peptidase